MKISILIPAHNEAESIVDTMIRLEQALRHNYEIIVVNDHSSDNTAQVVQEFAKSHKNIVLVDNINQPGFSNALSTGFTASKAELVLPVMADLCDDPETINKMYDKIEQGFDVVCGSRYMRGGKKIGGPKLKSFFSRIFGLSLHFIIGIPTFDIANSFKMYRRRVLDTIKIESKGFEISVEVPLKAFFSGYKITEIPTTWIDRKSGISKFDVKKQGSGYLKLYLWAIRRKISVCLLKKK
jgi:glycosyltransferase involved in cell wall biosynthesis